MEKVTNWYEPVPYADIKNIIRDRVTAMAREYISIGFFLRKVRDNEMYLEDGYKDIHDFGHERVWNVKVNCQSLHPD